MKNYDTQAVVCLDRDLLDAAQAHEAKPRVRGEAANIRYDGQSVLRSAMYLLGPQQILPEEYRLPTSRLVIVTHGTPSSRFISAGNGLFWDPEQLANAVKCWLANCCIKRIALKVCYAGGSRGGATRRTGEDLGKFFGRFTVSPRESFAYKFARVCGLAQTITAQTSESITSMTFKERKEDFEESNLLNVEEKVAGVRQGHAYKIILTPVKWASPTKPSDPGLSILNPTR